MLISFPSNSNSLEFVKRVSKGDFIEFYRFGFVFFHRPITLISTFNFIRIRQASRLPTIPFLAPITEPTFFKETEDKSGEMSRKLRNLEEDLSASDDDAPVEIDMSAGKKQSLSQARKFHDQERMSKEAEKERRRKRNEMFKLQKERKLETISKRAQALPTEVLEAVSAKSAKLSDEGREMTGSSNKSGEEDGAIFDEGEEDRLSDSGVEDDSNVNECDFIPLDSTKHGSLNVVTLQNYTGKKKSATETALEFRNTRLFGPQCAPRESAKQRQAKRMKKHFKQI